MYLLGVRGDFAAKNQSQTKTSGRSSSSTKAKQPKNKFTPPLETHRIGKHLTDDVCVYYIHQSLHVFVVHKTRKVDDGTNPGCKN